MSIAEKILRAKADYDAVYKAGCENGKYALYGTYILKETISADELPSINVTQNLAGKGVRAYFKSNTTNFVFREIEKITLSSNTKPCISVHSKSAYNESWYVLTYGLTKYDDFENKWVSEWYIDGKARTYDGDAKVRVITFTEPVNVPQEFYEAFTLLLDEGSNIYDEGFDIGVEQGKQAQYDEFCDSYYDYGKREDFNTAFAGDGWTNDNIPLKYDIRPRSAYMMFRATHISGDLKALFESRNIVFDTSNCISFGYMFNIARSITKVGVLDLSSVAIPPQGNTDVIFNNAVALEEIELIRTSNEVFPQFGRTAFHNLNSLVKIRFEGVIADDISFAHSPLLDEESRQNIIDCLADLTGGTAKTLTFHSNVVASLTTEQLTTIANKNWSIG